MMMVYLGMFFVIYAKLFQLTVFKLLTA